MKQLGCWVLLCIAVSSAAAADLDDLEALEGFFDGIMAVQLPQYLSPGGAVSVVKDGEVLFAKGYGWADKEAGISVDVETTLFRPGSNAKLFVWTAVMQLTERGMLDLDRDIQEYLDFPLPRTLLDGRRAGPITLRHLMTHTAGFEDVVSEVFVARADLIRPLGEYLQDVPARVFPAGETAAYSNYGTSLAAYVVERVSGQPFYAYVEEHIFQPLAMEYSTFRQPLPDELEPYMAKGYVVRDNSPAAGGFEWVQSYPAGGLASSTGDMARFMLAHLQEGEAVLEPETAAYMHRQHFTHHPDLTGMALGFIEVEHNGYRALVHGGDTPQMHTGLYLLPDEDVGLYVAHNGAAAGFARMVIFEAFMDRFFAAPPPQREPGEVDKQIGESYLGWYHPTRANFSGVESVLRLLQPTLVAFDEDGNLTMQAAGRQRRFGPAGDNVFQEVDGPFKVAGILDEEGRPAMLYTGDPFPLLRSPWYTAPVVLGLLLGGSVLWFGSFVLGFLRRIVVLRKGLAPAWNLWLPVLLFSFGMAAFFAILGTVMANINPDYGMPQPFFERPETAYSLLRITAFALAAAALWMLLSTARSWLRGRQRFSVRVYHSASVLWAGGLVWLLYYTNFLRW